MKKIFIIALIILSAGNLAFSQQVNVRNPQQVNVRSHEKVPPDKNAKFEFWLKSSNKLILEFENLQQIDSLPDLDSLLNAAWTDIQFLVEDLQDSLASRRFDYSPRSLSTRISLRQHPEKSSSFLLRNGEILQLRSATDSLRIQLLTTRVVKGKTRDFIETDVYYVSLLLNDIHELPSFLGNGSLSKAVEMLKADLHKNQSILNKHLPVNYHGQYNVETGEVWESISMMRGLEKYSFEFPVVQLGLQFVNGYWVPSLGAGLELVQRKSSGHWSYWHTKENHYRLLWEPYFFFESDSTKSFRINRNDFITFRWHNLSTDVNETSTVEFRQSASFGYLVRRKGDYFGETTFKFSLPGLQSKSILLEPEFVFNKFFKNFSPSLKLLYFFGED